MQSTFDDLRIYRLKKRKTENARFPLRQMYGFPFTTPRTHIETGVHSIVTTVPYCLCSSSDTAWSKPYFSFICSLPHRSSLISRGMSPKYGGIAKSTEGNDVSEDIRKSNVDLSEDVSNETNGTKMKARIERQRGRKRGKLQRRKKRIGKAWKHSKQESPKLKPLNS